MGCIDDYTVCEDIGTGFTSRVITAIHNVTKIKVAIKVISKASLSTSKEYLYIQQEVGVFKNLRHPFICQFFDYFETSTDIFIVMEFAKGGTLLNYVNERDGLQEREAAIIFAQILSSVVYLHVDCHIAHRDLKGENVLLDKNYKARLIDFGFSYTSKLSRITWKTY